MLINLWTGKRPNKATFEMLNWYFMGIIDVNFSRFPACL
jgi:hypothetical protein